MLSNYNSIISINDHKINIKKDISVASCDEKSRLGPVFHIQAGTSLVLADGAFRELLHAAYDYQRRLFDIEDAKARAEEFLEEDDLALLNEDDYVCIAKTFRDNFNAGLSEYDQWGDVIADYVEKLKERKTAAEASQRRPSGSAKETAAEAAGSRFSFKGFNWITLDHTEDGGVLAIMDGCWKEIPFDNKRDYTNNYAKSTLRKTLLEELLPVLGEENLMPHVVDLVADNGDNSYGTVTDKVFILSCDEYRKCRKHIPLLDEGSWTCTPWWISPTSGYGNDVRIISHAGDLRDSYASCSYGVAPACVFNLKKIFE